MIRNLIKLPLLKRIIPKLTITFLKIMKKQRGYFKINNFFLFLDVNEPIDRYIIIHKEYEIKEIRIFSNYIKKFNITDFIDIGANCGYYTFYLTDKFSELKTLSFEPNIDAFEKLCFSHKKNKKNKKNINVFNYGFSDTNSLLKMRALKKNNHVQSGGSTVNNKKDLADNEIIFTANFKIGDQVLNFQNKKIAIKIDVEGHEINVLKSLENTLKQNKIVIQIEIFDDNFFAVNNFFENIEYKLIFKIKDSLNYYYSNIK